VGAFVQKDRLGGLEGKKVPQLFGWGGRFVGGKNETGIMGGLMNSEPKNPMLKKGTSSLGASNELGVPGYQEGEGEKISRTGKGKRGFDRS